MKLNHLFGLDLLFWSSEFYVLLFSQSIFNPFSDAAVLFWIADLGSSFWGMIFILASTNLLTTRIAAGCFILALVVVLFVADNWFLRCLCIGFVVFIAVVWVIQEFTSFHILKYVILFIGVMNSLFSVYDIYDDLISRRVHSSDAEKFAEICPCPCNGVGWGVIWGFISFIFLCASIYLGLVILSWGFQPRAVLIWQPTQVGFFWVLYFSLLQILVQAYIVLVVVQNSWVVNLYIHWS